MNTLYINYITYFRHCYIQCKLFERNLWNKSKHSFNQRLFPYYFEGSPSLVICTSDGMLNMLHVYMVFTV